ncbi:General secretory system II protein E domain protein [Desulfovibrio sp. X2]|uniref:GspE/PulE/PilB domain-containing protein n=1 Tax=Desulfovibrio sp. X2 TaxID=941449 RepID=UPI000358F4CC|nr:General secretory system II protein E domain protein [Desulfovibrio sp. X2]EPR41758.1 General secretory system II protein E domain protein [Desulfovibrio sp. X2]
MSENGTTKGVQEMIAAFRGASGIAEDGAAAAALASGGVLHPYAALAETDKERGEDALVLAAAWLKEYGGHPEDVLLRRMAVGRGALLAALSVHTGLPAFSFTECLAIPPELLHALPEKVFAERRWFPVGVDHGAVIVAAAEPRDEDVRREAAACFPERELRWLVALRRDVRDLCLDYTPRLSGRQIGTERTALAQWRNTMATWRTRMACWRTSMAESRTWLNILRWGLGFVALGEGLMRSNYAGDVPLDILCMAGGFLVAVFSTVVYLRLRFSRFRPPTVQKLVEVSAVTLQFLEDYHFLKDEGAHRHYGEDKDKRTMLGRLGGFLNAYSTIMEISDGFAQRIHLARERNVLAAQRTVCACYRTIASRARTGLAFLRTGVTIFCLGLGLLHYFSLGPWSIVDGAMTLLGAGMIVDGAIWYLPVRKEYSTTPRCMAGSLYED